jgi:hypothetical protein
MNGHEKFGPGRALFGDGIIALLLVNEIRHRVVASLFGVSRADANPVTVIATVSLAEGVQGTAARVLGAVAVPSVAAAALGAVAVKETAHGIAGDWSRTAPRFGALIVFAVFAKSFGPMVRATIHSVRESLRAFRSARRRFLALLGGH